MAKTQSLPSYNDVQKIRLMDWIHKAFFDAWNLKIPLDSILYEALESLRKVEKLHQDVGLLDLNLDWLQWEGDMDDFLIHLYKSRIPGCVPFDCSQTVQGYVKVSFGQDPLVYLHGKVEEKDFQSFSHYLAACGFESKRLKRFTLPAELELLAKAALLHPAYPIPIQEPVLPPTLRTKKGSSQGEFF